MALSLKKYRTITKYFFRNIILKSFRYRKTVQWVKSLANKPDDWSKYTNVKSNVKRITFDGIWSIFLVYLSRCQETSISKSQLILKVEGCLYTNWVLISCFYWWVSGCLHPGRELAVSITWDVGSWVNSSVRSIRLRHLPFPFDPLSCQYTAGPGEIFLLQVPLHQSECLFSRSAERHFQISS